MSLSLARKCPNLKKEEKDAILNIVLKYKQIIEDKRTDTTSVNERNLVWQKITDEYNSTATFKRTMQQIKSFYKNAKCNMNKMLAHEKKERLKTGGGVIEGVKENIDVNTSLFEIVSLEVTPLSNDFDSTAEYFEHTAKDNAEIINSAATENENVQVEEEQNTVYIQTPNKNKTWSKKRSNFNDIRKYVNDFSELKKAKTESEILKNKKKMEMYEAKTELLKLQINELKNKKY